MANGYVYFILSPANGLVKVGYTADHPDVRLRRLRATCPVPLEPMGFLAGRIEVERQIHHRFAHLYSHGEWFALDADLAAFIRANAWAWEPRAPRFRRPLPRLATGTPARRFKRPAPTPKPAPVLSFRESMRRKGRRLLARGLPQGWISLGDRRPEDGAGVDWLGPDGFVVEGGAYRRGRFLAEDDAELLWEPTGWRPTSLPA